MTAGAVPSSAVAVVPAVRVDVVDNVPQAFADVVVDAVARRPGGPASSFCLVLSGGPTARRCYEALASRAVEVPWARLVILMGDERCVDPDDPDANQRLVREALLSHVPSPAAFHPMTVADGAAAYGRQLAGTVRPDLVHLGLGPDGHTASLFPGGAALCAPPGQLAVDSSDPSGRNPHRRMTLTLHALATARLALFTVSGAAKADAFAAVRSGMPEPAHRVRSEQVRWLVDAEAAGGAA